MRPPEERYFTESLENKQTEANARVTIDEPCQKEITIEVQNLTRWSYETPHRGETKEVTTASSSVTDTLSTEDAHGAVCNDLMENGQSAKLVMGEAMLKGPELSLKFLGVEPATKSQPEPGLYSSDKTTGDNSAENVQPVGPEVVRLVNSNQPNDGYSLNNQGVDKNYNSGKLEEAYPMISHLIENYKALAVVMRLAAMDPDVPHENCSVTSLNDRIVESNTDRTESEEDSGSFCTWPNSQLKPPQLANSPSVTILSEIDPGSITGKHIQQHEFIDDRLDSGCEYMYRFGTTNTGGNATNFPLHSGETPTINDLPNVEFSVDIPYDTLVCTPEEITLDESGATLLPIGHPTAPDQGQTKAATENASDYYLDIAVAESLPHDSSNDSFSVSDDSCLFSGSTKGELEKLQMEVKDHLEQAERQGGLLVVQWADDSGTKKIDRFDEEEGTNNLTGNQGALNDNDGEGCEGEESDRDERIEVFEFKYVDHCEDSGDDDGEIDQVINKILAWIALEDAKVEATMNSSKVMAKFDKGRIEEIVDTDSNDEETRKREETTIATRIVVEKELSVVHEEEDEEDGTAGEVEKVWVGGVDEGRYDHEVGEPTTEGSKLEVDDKGMKVEVEVNGKTKDTQEPKS